MASSTHFELELPFKLTCTYESMSGDRNVLFPGSTISRYKTNTMVTSGNNHGHEDDTRNAFHTSYRYRTTESLFEDIDDRNNTLRSCKITRFIHGFVYTFGIRPDI
jgi:hypothetical protein